MPAAAKTSQFPVLTSFRAHNCKLPAWDSVRVLVRGFKSFWLTDPAAIAPLYDLSGVIVWQGYDAPRPLGVATGAEWWVQLRFRQAGSRNNVAAIVFKRNEDGVYCWWFPNMKVTTDKHGKHKGWHPKLMIAIPRPFVTAWLAVVMPVVSEE